MIETGQPAPDFTLPRDGGDMVTLSALQPKAVVLYFYPRDDTSGCTKEALAFTDNLAAFEAAGAVVLGVSKDTVAKHD
ncbi:MAG: peroxiredoxin, partial [Alphaproteobacteria bacterium]|nr:peroxiredoxin [Alphaproteobacteria bacterium]